MQFDLSDDQRALQSAARDLLDARSGSPSVRAHLASDRPYDESLWAAMTEQGWLGVALAEAHGGLGLSWVEVSVLAEEIGRHNAAVPILPSVLALHAVVEADSTAIAERWAPRLLSGESIGCIAWSRHPDAIEAVWSSEQWFLTGRTDLVEAASVADIALVWTPHAVFAVDLREVGRPRREPAMDGTRALSWLTFDHTAAVRLGGESLADDLLNRGSVAVSAEMLGGGSRVLEMSSQYAKDRVQFGQPIGSFQAVKHRCADMLVDVEGMRSATWYAAWTIAADDPDASIAASTAKVWSSDAARRLMSSGLQVHGGIGFTWEHDLHLFIKRSQFDQQSFGDASYHRDRLIGLLREALPSGSGN